MLYFNEIQQLVCAGEGILPSVLQGKIRKREVVFCRQLIMSLLAKYNIPKGKSHKQKTATLAAIGEKYGKDHALVLYSIKVIQNLKDTNKAYAIKITAYEIQVDIIVEFENNIIKDRMVELKELIKTKIDTDSSLPIELVLVYNKLLQKEQNMIP
jgi:hypothetical protein